MEVWGKTDRGCVRKENQDCFYTEEFPDGSIVGVVFDGMGGERAGAVASKTAADAFEKSSKEFKKPSSNKKHYLEKCGRMANEAVYRRSMDDQECAGMGTTIVAAIASGKKAAIMNEGDSCGFLITEEGIQKVTKDHSFVQSLVDMGKITAEEARRHPKKNLITRALGMEPELWADFYSVDLPKDSAILLCSDGLSNIVTEQEILYEVLHGENDKDCCDRLVNIAIERGAPDNVTVVLLKNFNEDEQEKGGRQ